MRRVAGADQDPRTLRLAQSIHQWRWRLWILVPIAAALILLPMPDAVRILLAAPVVVLILVPWVLRIIGSFTAGYRGR
jgi:hypothetical protein